VDWRKITKATRCTGQSKLDSHADMCVAGCNTVVLQLTDTKVNVMPFSDE
jgi:hypothetical protein